MKQNYITEEQFPWLVYTLEKKITTFFAMGSALVVGICVSSWIRTICFLASFSIIRCLINGFHTKTKIGCCLLSVFLEMLFLIGFPSFFKDGELMSILFGASLVIFALAPYNHPKMHLSRVEIQLCAKRAKIRLAELLVTICVLKMFHYDGAVGISLGIILASFLLILAYIFKNGGITNDEEGYNG